MNVFVGVENYSKKTHIFLELSVFNFHGFVKWTDQFGTDVYFSKNIMTKKERQVGGVRYTSQNENKELKGRDEFVITERTICRRYSTS